MSESLEFLEQEAKAAERKVVVSGAVGIVLAGIVTGYMMWLNSTVDEAVQPELAADLTAQTAVSVIPEIGVELKTGLVAAAPDVAKALSNSLVDAVPALRQKLQRSIIEMTDEMAVASAEDAGNRLGKLLQGKSGEPDRVLDGAMAALVGELDKEIYGPPTARTSSTQSGIFTSMRQSADQLRRINSRLQTLAAKRNPNADEAAMKRLISTWLGVVSPPDEN